MDSLQKISNDLVQSINEKEKKKSIPYDTYAKVIRIDGGTAWVHIPGGVDETPVALAVNAKVGDSVLVRVSGGNAWIVGNSSAPPTDDTKAVEAKGVADVAQVKAASAQETAETAEEIAKDASRAVKSTNQYFWHTETDTGAGAGAHITEVPQEDFIADPANGGGNLLAQSGGIAIRDGVTELATFGADGQAFNNEYSRAVFSVGYLERQRFNGKYNSFAYDGTSPFVFSLPWDVNSIINVTYYDSTGAQVEDIPLHSGYALDGRTVTIDATTCALMNTYGVTRVLVYYSATGAFPFFILGDPGAEALGIMSTVMGDNCVASGYFSFAGGEGAIASGAESFAYGERPIASGIGSVAFGRNTVAAGIFQFVCGENNANDTNNIFEIGYGATEDSRKNAFAVEKSNGNVTAAGTITSEGHVSAIGHKTGRKTGTYSLASGKSFVTVPESALSRITLSEGTWIIHAHAAFASNNNGRRTMRIYDTTTSEGLTRSYINQPATNDAATNMNTMAIVDVGRTDRTYTVQLAQNSGSANSVDLILEAVRIA